ncbi:unnamed protein product, partial [Rotaria sordida]
MLQSLCRIQYLETGIQQNEDTQQINQIVSTLTSQTHRIISFHNNSTMAFIHGFNVNSEQRDQYISDTINVNTGPIVGKLSMIQSPKPSKQKYGSRLPRFRIGGDELKNDINHTLAFLAYIVSDNSSQINSLLGNSNNIHNNHLNDLSVLDQM